MYFDHHWQIVKLVLLYGAGGGVDSEAGVAVWGGVDSEAGVAVWGGVDSEAGGVAVWGG